MPVDLKTPDNTENLVKGLAAEEYCGAVSRFAADLLEEASRLEAANRSTVGDPEITSTMVRDADILLRRGYARTPRRPVLIGAQVTATVGGFITGLLANIEKLKDATTLVLFVVLLAITITAAVVSVVKE